MNSLNSFVELFLCSGVIAKQWQWNREFCKQSTSTGGGSCSGWKAWTWHWKTRGEAWRQRMRNFSVTSNHTHTHTYIPSSPPPHPSCTTGLPPCVCCACWGLSLPTLWGHSASSGGYKQETLTYFSRFFAWWPLRVCCPDNSRSLGAPSPTPVLMSPGFLPSPL